ncbi:MAG TPA: RidA family protein [Clostridia bacterium]
MNVYDRLKELNIELNPAPVPVGEFEHVRRVGNLLYVSGQGSFYAQEWIKGKAGLEVSIEDAQRGARYCVLNTLSVLQDYLGDLNRIKKVVKILGFVNCTPDFNEEPKVLNGASKTLIEIFGEAGRHARSAIGSNNLPMNIVCEIESIFEIYE